MPRKILLAEDDSFTRFMMSEVISALGYEFDIAQNGAECAELVRQNPDAYGVVLMDIHMPVLSGVDAARAIRQIKRDPPKNVPIIAVTADSEFYDKNAVDEVGMDGFLKKPIIASEINLIADKYCA